jgi:hypothetical protein
MASVSGMMGTMGGGGSTRVFAVGRVGAAMVVVVCALLGVGCSTSNERQGAPPGTESSVSSTTAVPAGGSTSTVGATPVTIALAPVGSSPTCAQALAARTPDALLSAFRAARVRGKGAEGCLTAKALASYCSVARPCSDNEFEADPGPICLYACGGYQVKDVTFEVTRLADGTFSVSVEVDPQPVGTPSAKRFPGSTHEGLILGPGVPAGATNTAPIVITDATTSA